jgi:hypothetical protein
MSNLQLTNKLLGDFGELIFEHFCIQNQYAYINLETIYKTLTPQNILEFKLEFKRFPVKVPDIFVEEIRSFCIPTNHNVSEPSFVFDYLTISLNNFQLENGLWVQKQYLNCNALNWVEVKTGKGQLTQNQIKYKDKSLIGVHVFRVKHVFPEIFSIEFESFHSKIIAESDNNKGFNIL